MLKTCCYSTSIFSSSDLDFGASWASKSAALLAAPGVLEPTAFMLALTGCFSFLRGGVRFQNRSQNLRMLGPCWHIFRSWASFFRSWLVLESFLCFLAHVGRFFRTLGRPGLDFGSSGPGFRAFKTTFDDVFWRSRARVAEMLVMQHNHSFCDVL